MEELLLPFMVVALNVLWASFLGWLIWLMLKRRAERQASAMEVRYRAMERFGTAEEFIRFLNSPAGARFLDPPTVDRVQRRIMLSLSLGLILFFLGIGFLICSQLIVPEMLIPGYLCSTLGIGLMAAAGLTHRLARTWGMYSVDLDAGSGYESAS